MNSREELKQFGDSSVDFDVSVWIDDPWTAGDRLSDLNEALWWALAGAGITIALPQVDVHFDQSVVGALAGARASVMEDSETN